MYPAIWKNKCTKSSNPPTGPGHPHTCPPDKQTTDGSGSPPVTVTANHPLSPGQETEVLSKTFSVPCSSLGQQMHVILDICPPRSMQKLAWKPYSPEALATWAQLALQAGTDAATKVGFSTVVQTGS